MTKKEIKVVMDALSGTPTLTTSEFADKVEKILENSGRNNMSIKEEVNVNKLIEKFTDMANRGTLLTGEVSQEDLLIQIIGIIVKVAMEPSK